MANHAKFKIGGLLRCCAHSVPVDDNNRVLAGTEGEHIPCEYCSDKEGSGVRFKNGVWRAAWRDQNQEAPHD